MISASMIRLPLCVLMVLQTFWALGQTGPGGFENYRTLNVGSGLPSNTVRCFEKDSEGYMWIGTAEGLVRYDGSQVDVFVHDPDDPHSISGNNISCLFAEGDSLLWVGTFHRGLNKLDLRTSKFTRFLPEHNNPESIPSSEVYALGQDSRGDLWVGYNRHGFGRYDRTTGAFEQIKLHVPESSFSTRQSNVVKDFLFNENDPNTVWILNLHSLVEYDLTTESMTRHSPLNDNSTELEIRLLVFTSATLAENGKIYLACDRFGVWTFDPKIRTWKNYREPVFNPENRFVNSFNLIAERGENGFWLAGRNRGLFVFDDSTGTISPLKPFSTSMVDHELPTNIKAWDMDEPEGFWMGNHEGVRLYNRQANQFEIHRHRATAEWLQGREGISVIYPINADEVYFGGYAGEGIYRYNLRKDEKRLISPPRAIERTEAKMFFLRDFTKINDSTLLALTYDNLYLLDLRTDKLSLVHTGLKFGEDYHTFNRILRTRSGRHHISTGYSGVYTLDSNFRHIGNVRAEPGDRKRSLVSSSYIYEICEDPETDIWIGTEDGFSRWNVRTDEISNFDHHSRADSVPNLKILYRIALAPDSSLWFIDGKNHAVYLEYPYSKPYVFKPVLTGNKGRKERLNNVLFSRSGTRILSTASGLTIVGTDGTFRRYTDKEGLPSCPPLAPMVEMEDGRIVMGTGNELVSFHPDSLHYTPNKNELRLRSVMLFDKALQVNVDSIVQHGLTLNFLQNFFTLNLGVLNFDNPDEFILSYRLKGFHDEWTTAPDKKAVFTNVPGGQYHFEARLIDKNGHVINRAFSLPIEMIPPIWKMWWFRLLAVLTGLGIITAFYVLQVRSVRRRAALALTYNKELANMEMVSLRAQMNPHFIFNSLNSIRHQIITNKNAEAERYLVKFSRLVRWILENSESHYITLHDEIAALKLYLELESKRFDGKFDYEVNIGPGIDTTKLSVPAIIIQPFVENAIWHGLMQKPDGGTVTVDVSKDEDNLKIRITDDGIGREQAEARKVKTGTTRNSMGLKITLSRLEVIKKLYDIDCSAEIEDLNNRNDGVTGTRVTITLPLIHGTENRNR